MTKTPRGMTKTPTLRLAPYTHTSSCMIARDDIFIYIYLVFHDGYRLTHAHTHTHTHTHTFFMMAIDLSSYGSSGETKPTGRPEAPGSFGLRHPCKVARFCCGDDTTHVTYITYLTYVSLRGSFASPVPGRSLMLRACPLAVSVC